MQNRVIATVATLVTLVLSSACTGTAVGSISEAAPQVDDDPSPPKKTLSDADASVPDDEPKCGGFPFNAQACGTCGASTCCDDAAACWGDTECRALSACISACGDAACKSECTTDHARGLTKYNALGTCAETKCSTECASTPPPPAKKGIGDRCTDSSECREGFCSGAPGWCTTACTQNEDCSGYPQLSNEYGKLNYCLETASGSHSCFPGCSTDADCTKYASGLTCKSTGSGAFVCSL